MTQLARQNYTPSIACLISCRTLLFMSDPKCLAPRRFMPKFDFDAILIGPKLTSLLNKLS